MVLENSPAPTSQGSLDKSAPLSDEDPFAAAPQAGTLSNYVIDRSSLPRPIPILGPLLGYNQEAHERLLQNYLNLTYKALHRPATQEEVDAYAYWTAKQISLLSYGVPLGFAGGCIAAYNSAATFRFPFWQPNLEKFQAEVFPPRLAILRGNRAIMAWHTMRLLVYAGLGTSIGYIFMGSYAMSSVGTGQLRDKRLKEVFEAIRQQALQRRRALPTPIQHRNAERGDSMKPDLHDDASPTGDWLGDESAGSGLGHGRVGVSEEGVREGKPRGGAWGQLPTASAEKETYENQDAGFALFDDASPTGGRGVTGDTAPQQGGSAWDRLRRGEKPMQSRQTRSSRPTGAAQPTSQNSWSKLRKSPQEEQVDTSAGAESLSFSDTYEERNLAKALAQMEFDAQVERERKGGDFNNSRGDQKRW